MLPIICLMGPTASGKTPLAIELVQQFPLEIVSVDSAMIYKGMDIGTAKPDAATLKIAPHHLIDILDPKEIYSAGQFREDALKLINDIHARNKIPLLVGGTMLYFRVLQSGLATLPQANPEIREQLLQRANQVGWEALHLELAKLDPIAATRIHPNDSQRIQRALEIFYVTGQPMSSLLTNHVDLSNYDIKYVALMPTDRARLHARIAERFEKMLAQGFVEEVQTLFKRGDLNLNLPAIRAVGYSQIWEHLSGNIAYADMCAQAIAATRQLAKRQITWLRSWPNVNYLESESKQLVKEFGEICRF